MGGVRLRARLPPREPRAAPPALRAPCGRQPRRPRSRPQHHSTGDGGGRPALHGDTGPSLAWPGLWPPHPAPSRWGGEAQEAHLVATVLQRRRFGLVCPGRDVDLGATGAAASWEWAPHAPGALLPRPPTLTCRTTPTTGRFRVRPGTGAGHWSISLHTADRGGQHQQPVPGKGCWPKPLGTVAGRRELLAWPDGRSPASRQGASLSKYSGAIRPSSAWNSRTKGRRETSTRDCRAHRAARWHLGHSGAWGPPRPGSPGAACPGNSTGQLSPGMAPDPRVIR